MFCVAIVSCEPVSFSWVCWSTGKAREEPNRIKSIILFSDLFRTSYSSVNWKLSLNVRQVFVFRVVQKLYHCSVVSFNVLELRVSHSNVDRIVGCVVGVRLYHSLKTPKFLKFLVVFEIVNELEKFFPVLFLALVNMHFEDLIVFIIRIKHFRSCHFEFFNKLNSIHLHLIVLIFLQLLEFMENHFEFIFTFSTFSSFE